MSDSLTHTDPAALLSGMPVYLSRMAAVNAALETGGPVTLDDFFMHYDGDAPLAAAAEFFEGSVTVLDLGCGYGSSLLWLANRSEDYRALAGVDLLDDNIIIARSLAARLMTDDHRTSFFAHDVSTLNEATLGGGCGVDQVDAVLSLNVGVHLTEVQREKMWQFVSEILLPGGRVYIEDFYRLRELDEREEELLAQQLACPYLPDLNEYLSVLSDTMEDAKVVHEDLSFNYGVFAAQHHETYDGDDEVRREFYRAMSFLLNDGAVGGLRIRLERPPQ